MRAAHRVIVVILVSRHVLGIVVAGLLMLAAACRIDASYDGTMYQCPDGRCPPGYTCVNGQCVRQGGNVDAMPGDPDAAPGEDGGPPDPPPPPDPRFGNVLFYTFDGDIGEVSMARDRGPHGLDGHYNGSFNTGGRYGQGHRLDDGDGDTQQRVLRISDDSRLFLGNRLTIEAWISPSEDQDQAIFSDLDGTDAPDTEYSFELTAGGGLAFYSNDDCADGELVAATDAAGVPVGTFTHVAVTWDGTDARFYVAGALVDTVPFASTPCEYPGLRAWFVGRRSGGANVFDGVIDEVKVSDYPKTEAEIRMSMEYDSAAAGSRCGDGLIEGTEQCDGANACCDTASCSFEDGTACPGGTCERGVCRNGSGRVNQGLVAYYDFSEGSGATVADRSGVVPALNLTIADPASVTWGPGTLTLAASTLVSSATAAVKIASACQGSNELTVEAWVAPANDTQSGPARVVTMSVDSGARNFTLGQSEDAYILRVRTSSSDSNGQPSGHTPAGDASPALTHLVATRSADGLRRMYVNGVLRGRNRTSGDFSSWDDSWRLGLANELNTPVDDRTWLGTYHLVAVYCRALPGLEVARNFFAGPDPEL